MTATNTRLAVWNGLLEANRLVRYYGTLADRHNQWNTWILRGLIFGGSTEAILVFAKAPEHLIALFALAVAGIAAWAVAGDYAKKAAVLHGISLECSYLEIEWDDLWNRMDLGDLSDDRALKRNQELQRRLTAATSRAMPAGIREDRKLNKKSWIETCRALEQQYA